MRSTSYQMFYDSVTDVEDLIVSKTVQRIIASQERSNSFLKRNKRLSLSHAGKAMSLSIAKVKTVMRCFTDLSSLVKTYS